MKYKEYLESQFEVKKITIGESSRKEVRVCFKTPLANYTLSPQDWEIVKEKILKV